MSNHDNHRRDEKKRTEHGPTFESQNPGKGSNATHVARSRKKWKRREARCARRTGHSLPSFRGGRPQTSEEIDE